MKNAAIAKVLLVALLLADICECGRVRRQDLIPFPRVGKRGHLADMEAWTAEDEVIHPYDLPRDDSYSLEGPIVALLEALLRDLPLEPMTEEPSGTVRDHRASSHRTPTWSKATEENLGRTSGRRGPSYPAALAELWKSVNWQDQEAIDSFMQNRARH